MTLVFATNNANKAKEVSRLLGETITLKTLADIGFTDNIPEEQDTLEGNALQKARTVAETYNCSCFADDTGLEVEALDSMPGVYSARYAGPECDAEANMNKLLNELEGQINRRAQFRTVIALIVNGKEYLFEGKVEGVITVRKRGEQGFGYDPIFMPDGYSQTFAQMALDEKNKISHRALATNKLVEFIQSSKL